MSSVVKAVEIREISMEGNPIALIGDCVSFLVSYLPNLELLSQVQVQNINLITYYLFIKAHERCTEFFYIYSICKCNVAGDRSVEESSNSMAAEEGADMLYIL